ncbi:MAG TPA: glycoside hydrolase family 99-like domain-containing protein [Dehalococcoidia bacterium]
MAFSIPLVADRQLTSATTVSQPQTPITAAFFYPWYPSHWTENGVYPYTNFTPSLGYYSSMDPAVVTEQLTLAGQARIDAFISSWWEPGEVTDVALQQILGITEQTGAAIRWSTYYEGEAYGDPAPATIAADLLYMETNLFSSPAYLRVDDKPVIFVYASGSDGCAMADRWAQAQTIAGIDAYIVLKVFYGYATCADQPESWHQYSPTSAFEYHGPYSVSVSPGFAKIGETAALKRSLATFETGVQWMALVDVDWRLITTWNEWAEGTSIEPATEYGNAYIDILCRNLPGSIDCVSSITTPTPTPGSTASTDTPLPTDSALPPLAPTATPTPASTAPPPLSLYGGDGDCDGDTDSVDVLHILRFAAGLAAAGGGSCPDAGATPVSPNGDVDCDDDVDSADALELLRFLAGLPFSLSGSCPPTE